MEIAVVSSLPAPVAFARPEWRALAEAHAQEVDALGLGVRIDYDRYFALEAAGRLVTFLAVDKGLKPLGYFLVDVTDSPLFAGKEAEEVALYVTPEARGSGAAQALLAEARSVLKARGVRNLVITVRDQVPGARKFVQSLGFNKFAECYGIAL